MDLKKFRDDVASSEVWINSLWETHKAIVKSLRVLYDDSYGMTYEKRSLERARAVALTIIDYLLEFMWTDIAEESPNNGDFVIGLVQVSNRWMKCSGNWNEEFKAIKSGMYKYPITYWMKPYVSSNLERSGDKASGVDSQEEVSKQQE